MFFFNAESVFPGHEHITAITTITAAIASTNKNVIGHDCNNNAMQGLTKPHKSSCGYSLTKLGETKAHLQILMRPWPYKAL